MGLAAPDRRRTAVAIRGYAPVSTARAAAQVITFAPTAWPAYAWSFPVGDGTANVGYGEVLAPGRDLTRADLLHRLDALLPGASEGADGWRAHLLPLSTARTRQPDGPVLLAGDAAALINPLTGEGIYYAVLSGALAGRAAVTAATDPGRAYRGALRRRLGRHLVGTDVVAALTRSPRVVDGGITAAAHDRHVFDTLVEVGLGDGVLTARAAGGVLAAAARHATGRSRREVA
jgi:flavin-dependent dehydrogenase